MSDIRGLIPRHEATKSQLAEMTGIAVALTAERKQITDALGLEEGASIEAILDGIRASQDRNYKAGASAGFQSANCDDPDGALARLLGARPTPNPPNVGKGLGEVVQEMEALKDDLRKKLEPCPHTGIIAAACSCALHADEVQP
jgi:hypothetical protein